MIEGTRNYTVEINIRTQAKKILRAILKLIIVVARHGKQIEIIKIMHNQ
jgi:hypothetical protein